HRDEARAEKFDDLCVVEHCLTGKHAVASGPTEAIAGIHDQEYWLALLCSELARFGERNLPPNRCPWLVLEVELLGEQSKLGIGQLAGWLVVGTDTDHARAYCSHAQSGDLDSCYKYWFSPDREPTSQRRYLKRFKPR